MAVTENKNFLNPNGFRITIDSTKFANIEYFCIAGALPAISLGPVDKPFRGNQNFEAGDQITYDPLNIRFMVDENMAGYLELFNWIKQNARNDEITRCDMVIHILNSANLVNKQFKVTNAFPVSLGSVDLNTQNTDVEHATCSASFVYNEILPV